MVRHLFDRRMAPRPSIGTHWRPEMAWRACLGAWQVVHSRGSVSKLSWHRRLLISCLHFLMTEQYRMKFYSIHRVKHFSQNPQSSFPCHFAPPSAPFSSPSSSSSSPTAVGSCLSPRRWGPTATTRRWGRPWTAGASRGWTSFVPLLSRCICHSFCTFGHDVAFVFFLMWILLRDGRWGRGRRRWGRGWPRSILTRWRRWRGRGRCRRGSCCRRTASRLSGRKMNGQNKKWKKVLKTCNCKGPATHEYSVNIRRRIFLCPGIF